MQRLLRLADYELFAVQVRALVDAAVRKAALLILYSEIRGIVWSDDTIGAADQLASSLAMEAIRIDANPLDALRVLITRHGFEARS